MLLHDLADSPEYLVDCSDARNSLVFALCAIIFGYYGCLRVVNLDAIADYLFRCVVGASRNLAAQQNALHEFLLRNIHVYHDSDPFAARSEQLVECLRLRRRAGETVENGSFAALVLGEIVLYHADHDFVGSKFAAFDV